MATLLHNMPNLKITQILTVCHPNFFEKNCFRNSENLFKAISRALTDVS